MRKPNALVLTRREIFSAQTLSVPIQLSVEPGSSESPFSLGSCSRNAEVLCRLFQGTTGEEPQLDESRLVRMLRLEFPQCVVEGQEIEVFVDGGSDKVGQVDALPGATAFQRLAATGVVHKDPPHGFGRSGKKVATRIPMLSLVHIHKPQVCLMNQGRRLQRVIG